MKARTSSFLASSGGEPAAGHVIARHLVHLADRRAVGAFHVVGEDFEFGLGVGGGALFQQQALKSCAASVFCAFARDLDRGRGNCPSPRPSGPRAPPGWLVASGSAWVDAGDEFAHGIAAADGHAAELEMRAFASSDLDFEPGVVAADDDREHLRPRALADVEADAVECRRIARRRAIRCIGASFRPAATRYVVPLRRASSGVELGKRLEVGIAPVLVSDGRVQFAHAATTSS